MVASSTELFVLTAVALGLGALSGAIVGTARAWLDHRRFTKAFKADCSKSRFEKLTN